GLAGGKRGVVQQLMAQAFDGKTVPLGTGAVEIVLDLTEPGAALDLTFDHPDVDLGVKLDADGLAIVFDARTGKTPPRYVATGAKP
ncbi:hypothetical protein ACC689_35420, partial [Rhizobium ruizarguesonis]